MGKHDGIVLGHMVSLLSYQHRHNMLVCLPATTFAARPSIIFAIIFRNRITIHTKVCAIFVCGMVEQLASSWIMNWAQDQSNTPSLDEIVVVW